MYKFLCSTILIFIGIDRDLITKPHSCRSITLTESCYKSFNSDYLKEETSANLCKYLKVRHFSIILYIIKYYTIFFSSFLC